MVKRVSTKIFLDKVAIWKQLKIKTIVIKSVCSKRNVVSLIYWFTLTQQRIAALFSNIKLIFHIVCAWPRKIVVSKVKVSLGRGCSCVSWHQHSECDKTSPHRWLVCLQGCTQKSKLHVIVLGSVKKAICHTAVVCLMGLCWLLSTEGTVWSPLCKMAELERN